MKYQSNENPTYGYFTNDVFGMVSYIKDTKTVVEQIESYVTLKSLPQLIGWFQAYDHIAIKS